MITSKPINQKRIHPDEVDEDTQKDHSTIRSRFLISA